MERELGVAVVDGEAEVAVEEGDVDDAKYELLVEYSQG
jgi:hypothetical protein